MHPKTWTAPAVSMAMLVGSSLHPVPASAATGTAAIVATTTPGVCVGDVATLTWEPPAGVDDLVGFEIRRENYDGHTPSGTTEVVGPAQRSLDFTLSFFMNSFAIRTVSSSGVASEPFARASTFGSRAPFAMEWDHHVDPADVGDGHADVRFAWAGPVTTSTRGGTLPVSVRITAAPGGTDVEIPASGGSVAHTFTGLTNGSGYRFSAVTSNACGASGSSPSATYVPGVRPAFVQDDPPATVRKNKLFSYRFAASGSPAPTYSLRDAPAWLSVSPDGLVSGVAPRGVATFSFSVVANNGVGIDYPGLEAPVVSGPHTVAVVKGARKA